MKELILSVIVPIYNGEQYVERLVDCVKKQIFTRFELILVDDGSVDNTYQKCLSYQTRYNWIRVLHTENKGVSHARNTGLNEAKGKWIQFLDADDFIYKDMFWDFYRADKKFHTELIICSCLRKNLKTGEEVLCGPVKNEILDEPAWKEKFCNLPMETRYWLLDYVWNKWYRKDTIDAFHIRFQEGLSLGEDFVFNTQYFSHINTAVLLKNVYYEYLVSEAGLASRFHPKVWEGRNLLYFAHKQLYQSLGIWEMEREQVQRQAGQITFGDIRTINTRQCDYTRKEKKQFIRNITESEQWEFVLLYLKSKTNLFFRIYYSVFSSKNADIILKLINLEKTIRYFKKK